MLAWLNELFYTDYVYAQSQCENKKLHHDHHYISRLALAQDEAICVVKWRINMHPLSFVCESGFTLKLGNEAPSNSLPQP